MSEQATDREKVVLTLTPDCTHEDVHMDQKHLHMYVGRSSIRGEAWGQVAGKDALAARAGHRVILCHAFLSQFRKLRRL